MGAVEAERPFIIALYHNYSVAYDVSMDVVHKYRWAQKPVGLIRTWCPRIASLARASGPRLTSVDNVRSFLKADLLVAHPRSLRTNGLAPLLRDQRGAELLR